jgi:hypothetical protein
MGRCLYAAAIRMAGRLAVCPLRSLAPLHWCDDPRARDKRPGSGPCRMAIHWLRGVLLAAIGLSAGAIWLALVMLVPPDVPFADLLFFSLLFATTAGAASAVAYAILPHLARTARPYRRLTRSIGVGCALALIIVLAGWLQSLRLLTPLNGVLLAGMAACALYLAVPKSPT